MPSLLNKIVIFVITLLFLGSINIYPQDTERPLTPELELLTVAPTTGFSILEWVPGGSPDVAGYVIYLFSAGEGTAFDTIYDPFASTYLHSTAYANIFKVDYVVAAIDSSDNVSPLSNPLNTIFAECRLDTCSHNIELKWNKYNDYPLGIDRYLIQSSVDGSAFTEIGSNQNADTTFSYHNFETGKSYCFTIKAELTDGRSSESNMTCINTDIPRPPSWINGNYANVDAEDNIEISFSFDQASEIRTFVIQKSSSPDGPFVSLTEIYSASDQFTSTDTFSGSGPQYYRAAALNNCQQPVAFSNTLTAMNLITKIVDDNVLISWSAYNSFEGVLTSYEIYRTDLGNARHIGTVSSSDTSYIDQLNNFSYTTSSDEICYYIEASESANPNTQSYLSRSRVSCIELPQRVFVPNAFTPDGDLLNDEFSPVMAFIPSRYKLLITSKTGIRLFETTNHLQSWDGSFKGNKLQADVYLWFLELTTPGGKEIKKNGTVTIIIN